MDRQQISTPDAPRPREGAPYAQAIAFGPLVFVSGQLPVDPATGTLVAGGITEQTEQVFRNLAAVLRAAGTSVDALLKTTVYLSAREDWEAMNAVYREFVGDIPPARSAVTTPDLSLGALVEIEAIAARAGGLPAAAPAGQSEQ